jgi:hypothetical protein
MVIFARRRQFFRKKAFVVKLSKDKAVSYQRSGFSDHYHSPEI